MLLADSRIISTEYSAGITTTTVRAGNDDTRRRYRQLCQQTGMHAQSSERRYLIKHDSMKLSLMLMGRAGAAVAALIAESCLAASLQAHRCLRTNFENFQHLAHTGGGDLKKT